jgi:hypothetical protein
MVVTSPATRPRVADLHIKRLLRDSPQPQYNAANKSLGGDHHAATVPSTNASAMCGGGSCGSRLRVSFGKDKSFRAQPRARGSSSSGGHGPAARFPMHFNRAQILGSVSRWFSPIRLVVRRLERYAALRHEPSLRLGTNRSAGNPPQRKLQLAPALLLPVRQTICVMPL